MDFYFLGSRLSERCSSATPRVGRFSRARTTGAGLNHQVGFVGLIRLSCSLRTKNLLACFSAIHAFCFCNCKNCAKGSVGSFQKDALATTLSATFGISFGRGFRNSASFADKPNRRRLRRWWLTKNSSRNRPRKNVRNPPATLLPDTRSKSR